MSEIKTATGVCIETTQKPGSEWVTFSVDVGSQYPVRLQTKLQPLIELGRATGDKRATWTYKETESENVNPNSGKPYMNRYLERIDVATDGQNPASTAQAPVVSGPKDKDVDWDAKERRDYRSRAWAQTLATFQHTIKVDEEPEAVFLRLMPFQRKVYEDVCGAFAYPADDSDVPFSG